MHPISDALSSKHALQPKKSSNEAPAPAALTAKPKKDSGVLPAAVAVGEAQTTAGSKS